jgi:hypothetical protein
MKSCLIPNISFSTARLFELDQWEHLGEPMAREREYSVSTLKTAMNAALFELHMKPSQYTEERFEIEN